jgi:hypothetical protein
MAPGPCRFCAFCAAQSGESIVAADTDNDFHSSGILSDGDTDQFLMLVIAEGRVFPCRSTNDNSGSAVLILEIEIHFQPVVIDTMFVKWCDNRRTGAFEHRCFHSCCLLI